MPVVLLSYDPPAGSCDATKEALELQSAMWLLGRWVVDDTPGPQFHTVTFVPQLLLLGLRCSAVWIRRSLARMPSDHGAAPIGFKSSQGDDGAFSIVSPRMGTPAGVGNVASCQRPAGGPLAQFKNQDWIGMPF